MQWRAKPNRVNSCHTGTSMAVTRPIVSIHVGGRWSIWRPAMGLGGVSALRDCYVYFRWYSRLYVNFFFAVEPVPIYPHREGFWKSPLSRLCSQPLVSATANCRVKRLPMESCSPSLATVGTGSENFDSTFASRQKRWFSLRSPGARCPVRRN